MTAGERRDTTGEPAIDLATPDALYLAGLGHLREGRLLDAQSHCQRALAIDEHHADTLHLMGLLYLRESQLDHAVAWLVRAIRQAPKVEYLLTLGTTLRQQGRREEALATFDKAVQLKPDQASLWREMAEVLLELDRPDDALLGLQHALTLDPRDHDAAYGAGCLLHRMERFEEALAAFDRCAALQPGRAMLAMRTQCLIDLRRFEDVLAENMQALAHDPDNTDIANSIAVALQLLGREEEAQPWFDRVLEGRPDNVAALTNKASSLIRIGRLDEAAALHARVLRVDPGNAAAAWDLALLDLLNGNFETGWARREARWRMPRSIINNYPQFLQPMWRGEDSVDGKTVLVRTDEGFGDSIQFARYIPLLAARGARVVLAEVDALAPLFSQLPGLTDFVPLSAGALPPFDMHCPMTSLPFAFRTTLETIPSAAYLPPRPADHVRRWDERLGRHDRVRVGLSWAGNPKHLNDHNRSIALRRLAPLLGVDAQFVSLQKNPRDGDAATLREWGGVVDLTADLTDFGETAALVSCLDLVITVDTSVAHLAATLGRPTWVLLPHTPDWRWLLGRDDSPWYPTMRLFRQAATRDYGTVLDRVRDELAARATRFSPPGAGHRSP